MQPSEIQRALAAAMSIASALGLPVDDVIVLHDSNKLTARLRRRTALPGPHQAGRTIGHRNRPQRAGLCSAKTFTDRRLCAAIVDRLTFAGQIIETGTTSYRLAHARQRRAARSPTQSK
jgi:hypothetical protein